MQMDPSPMEEYARALAQEKAAWEAVRNRLPGSADYSQDLWMRWRTAVDAADQAACRAKKSAALPPTRSPGSRSMRTLLAPGVAFPPSLSGGRGHGPQP